MPHGAQAGLEDPILGALYHMLAVLSAEKESWRAAFHRYSMERLGIFLPEDRAERVGHAMLAPAQGVTPSPGSAISEQFVAINVIEALGFLSSGMQEEALEQVGRIAWLQPHLDTALAWTGRLPAQHSTAEAGDVLRFAAEDDADVGAIPLRCRGARLAALRNGSHWFMRHTSATESAVSFGKAPWPPGHTLWLKAADRVTFGDEWLDAESLQLLQSLSDSHPGHGTRWHLVETPGRLRLTRAATLGGGVLELGGGAWVEGGDAATVLLNGQPVTRRTPILPGDRIQAGAWSGPAARLLLAGRSDTEPEVAAPWSVHLENVSLSFPDGTDGLSEVSVALQAGDFVAVMGPSGCGKSTLISLLCGEHPPTSGRLQFRNAAGGRPPAFALVPQDDILFENLTVAENLEFAAQLRAPRTQTDQAGVVDSVLRQVGLAEKRHLRVGSVVSKVLSGGQRKRLNIGQELTGDPDALLLDEPTSGLSSADALEVGRLLRRKADAGMLVLAVVHQPSRELFSLFDKVLVMDVGGRVACFGSAAFVPEWFARLSPTGGGQVGPDSILDVMVGSRSMLDGRTGWRRTYDPEFWRRLYAGEQRTMEPALLEVEVNADASPEVPCALVTDSPPPGRRPETARVIQRREWLRWCRDWPSTLSALGMAAVLAVLVSWVCRSAAPGEGYTFARNGSVPAFCFLAVVLVQFLALSSSVQEIVKDRAVRRRERLLRVPGWTWLLGKLPFLLVQSTLYAVLVLGSGIMILGMPYAWAGLAFTLVLTGASGVALGLAVSCLPFMTARTALAAVPLLLVPQMVLCGADPFGYEKLGHLHWPAAAPDPPDARQAPWVSGLMPSRWGYQALLGELRDDPFLRRLDDSRVKRFRMAELFFQRNSALRQTDPAAFVTGLREKVGDGYDETELMEDAAALIRAGYRSPDEVLEKLGPAASGLAGVPQDRKHWINEILLAHAHRTLPDSATIWGRPVSPAVQAWTVLIALSAVFLLLAGALLSLDRRLEEMLRFFRSAWRSRLRLKQVPDSPTPAAGGAARKTSWHWGPLDFAGLFGLHGTHLCFHRYTDDADPHVLVDPAKPIIALSSGASSQPGGEPPR